ncbi:MAG: sialate O-acetylesterase [Pseudomonadota bacterium]
MLGVGLRLTLQVGRRTGGHGPGSGKVLVFAMLGQSNMIGRSNFDGGPNHPDGVQQWGRTGAAGGTLIPATIPLDHVDPGPTHMGLDISFAEAVLAERPGTCVIFVPGAEGGTGFQTGHWRPGDVRYDDAVQRVNDAMAALPGAHLAGILWHQGESDVGNAAYQSDLDALVVGLRQDITAAGPTTPFVVGGLVPGWVQLDSARQAVQAVLEGTPTRVPHTGFASTAAITGAGTDIHFTAADLRALGTQYAAAWRAVAAPQPIGQIPSQTDLAAETGPGAPPAASAPIPDQTDPQGMTPPQVHAPIPDQQDTLS